MGLAAWRCANHGKAPCCERGPRAGVAARAFSAVALSKVGEGFVAPVFDFELSNGLQLIDLLVIAKGGKVWINVPSKARLRGEGSGAA